MINTDPFATLKDQTAKESAARRLHLGGLGGLLTASQSKHNDLCELEGRVILLEAELNYQKRKADLEARMAELQKQLDGLSKPKRGKS